MSDWTSMAMDLPSEAERRRYALLQAAATLLASAEPAMDEMSDVVTDAEALLAEIERREKETA